MKSIKDPIVTINEEYFSLRLLENFDIAKEQHKEIAIENKQ